ncbi:MAG: hypothetical protein GX029_06395, partial [Pseudomonadaceae bacterium]|nr:hypothetical protein [Pseudomonadaceae bacterium]
MYLRILILFLISLSLNAAEMVWDADSTKKVKKISDSEYQSVLDGYLNGLAKNPEKAFERGVEAEKHKHYESALYLYRLSASQNFLPAQHNLAYMYANNLGITKKDSESIKTKVSQAQVILSKLDYDIKDSNGVYSLQTFDAVKTFQKDIGGPQTGWVDQKLLDELKKSEIEADKQAEAILQATADFNAALKADKAGNYQEAARLYKLSADQGNASAQFNLGDMYKSGEGVQQDYQEAARLYKLSADQGNARAQVNLGQMYQNGLGVKQNDQEAARLFKLSADQGNTSAQNNLGMLYD